MDQSNQPVSSPQASPRTRAAAFSVHIFTAIGAGIGLIALLEAVREHWAAMFAWLGLALVVDALDGPIARRFDVVRLQPNCVGRGARSRGRFCHLCLRAGLRDHRQRPADAVGGAAAGRRHRRVQRAVFRGSPHENRRQSFPRISGAVERRGILSVPAASAAVAGEPCGRAPDRADIRSLQRDASDPRRAAARADLVADRHWGGACDLRAGQGFRCRARP